MLQKLLTFPEKINKRRYNLIKWRLQIDEGVKRRTLLFCIFLFSVSIFLISGCYKFEMSSANNNNNNTNISS
ncbi:hypothetical protein, partial [Lactococcus sp. UBA7128]|uniref:hypothetical protein n=1 Tax=Lactococcus sp. UBA7128 TaxID=1946733 RepID=UPI00257D23EB